MVSCINAQTVHMKTLTYETWNPTDLCTVLLKNMLVNFVGKLSDSVTNAEDIK